MSVAKSRLGGYGIIVIGYHAAEWNVLDSSASGPADSGFFEQASERVTADVEAARPTAIPLLARGVDAELNDVVALARGAGDHTHDLDHEISLPSN